MKNIMILLAIFLLMVSPVVVAQENELGNPGITPDSAFYFLDRIFDGFQSAESRADEKAAEALAMARESKTEHAERALGLYEGALNRLNERAQNNEEIAERVAEKTTNHLVVLANVLEQVPDEAKPAIERALEASTRGRDESINALTELNPSRGEQVANQTLQRVMNETPEEAQEGLMKAFNSVGSNEYAEASGQAVAGEQAGTQPGTTGQDEAGTQGQEAANQ